MNEDQDQEELGPDRAEWLNQPHTCRLRKQYQELEAEYRQQFFSAAIASTDPNVRQLAERYACIAEMHRELGGPGV